MVMTRRDIIEVGRRLWQRGLVSGTDGNLSIRMKNGRILATVSGVAKGFLKDGDIVEMRLDGTIIGERKKRPSSEIRMHLTTYRLRPDVAAICHAHPPYATAFAVAGRGITGCVIPEIIVALGAIPLAPYATPSTEEVPESIEPYIRGADAVLLENHGALTVGADLFEALYKMESLDHAARILLASMPLGGPHALNPEQVAKLRDTRRRLGFQNPAPLCNEDEPY
ncbi:MAG: class II aldolase/adducin family protein [Candidatus Hydrogenedentota bacterium]|nr:MAG: class II aldolase/adducin family protein [Candidatus Hydrogenedentota bacterium]